MTTKAPNPMFIPLNDAQLQCLKPFFDHVSAEAAAGRPGMLIAQIGHFGNTEMKVGFLRHEIAKKFQEGSGFNPPEPAETRR